MQNLRKNVLMSSLHDQVRYLKRLVYYDEINFSNIYEVCEEYGYTFEEVNEAIKLNNCYYARLKRVKKRFDSMVENCLTSQNFMIFLTFTFNDDFIDYDKKTLRVYVARYLRKYCLDYVANVDYGKKRGRMHYHAVVLVSDNIDYTKWKYGALNGKKVVVDDAEVRCKVSKYITKLSAHALKTSTRFESLIYCRKKKED